MILVALGSNQSGVWGTPRATLERALGELEKFPLRLVCASRLLETAPFGRTNQPPFVNAVAELATHLSPQALLIRLQMIERAAGRRRGMRWGPRTLDLDIIDYHGLRLRSSGGLRQSLTLPHPGIAERIFVLKPLSEIAPRWRHPVSRLPVNRMLARLQGRGEGAEL